jgi:hypothetical protein
LPTGREGERSRAAIRWYWERVSGALGSFDWRARDRRSAARKSAHAAVKSSVVAAEAAGGSVAELIIA